MFDPCPVCAATRSTTLGVPTDVPLLMNRVYATEESAREAPRGRLDLVGCLNCGFLWNRAFRAEQIAYDMDYENDQTHSAAFAAHLRARAMDVVRAVPAGEKIAYLEIGCGQGRFITEISAVAGDRLVSAEGFDPAWRGEDGIGPGNSRIHKAYFDSCTARLLTNLPNVVASRHTIEHVPDPITFLSLVRTALGSHVRARIFLETPCVSWILKHQAMQDFFYEHCSLFTARALSLALRKAGFRSPFVQHVFDGQYLWAEATTYGADEILEAELPYDLRAIAGAHERFVTHWRERVCAAAGQGPVALWGAGAKGVTFALMIDPDSKWLDHVIDINPSKQNRHIAGTGLRIFAPNDAASRRAHTIFVMNPHYLNEIATMASNAGIIARLVPIN